MVSLATLATDGVSGTTDGSSRCHRLLKMSLPFYKFRKTIQSQLAKAQSKAQLPKKPTEKVQLPTKPTVKGTVGKATVKGRDGKGTVGRDTSASA